MANVRSNVLTRGARAGPYWNNIYTCPANRTTIVKHFTLTTQAATPFGYLIYCASTGATVEVSTGSVSQPAPINLAPYWVLRPSDRLVLRWDTASTVNFWVSGVQLAGVAPDAPQGPVAIGLLPADLLDQFGEALPVQIHE